MHEVNQVRESDLIDAAKKATSAHEFIMALVDNQGKDRLRRLPW